MKLRLTRRTNGPDRANPKDRAHKQPEQDSCVYVHNEARNCELVDPEKERTKAAFPHLKSTGSVRVLNAYPTGSCAYPLECLTTLATKFWMHEWEVNGNQQLSSIFSMRQLLSTAR
jgi:hypothetical protein